MRFFRLAFQRFLAVFGRRSLEADMQAEMRAHLDQATERYIARGMTPANARLAARREFGNVASIEEDARDARGTRFVESLVADVRFAFRQFARRPLMATTIILVLALGIGANSAVFSFIQAFTVRPAPAVPKDAAHVRVYGLEQRAQTARWQYRDFTYPELTALEARKETFANVAGWNQQEVIFGPDSTNIRRSVLGEFVTPGYWRALGVSVTGPGFAEAQHGVEDVAVVMSHMLAAELFDTLAPALSGANVSPVGRRLIVNDIPVRIVGVAPDRFQGALADHGRPHLWFPMSSRSSLTRIAPTWVNESQIDLFARLAPGVSAEQATAVVRSVVAQHVPDSVTNAGWKRSAEVLPMPGPVPAVIGDDNLIAFSAISLVAILILLVACTNVSSLLVAAAVGRRHEIAVRLSMGAPRGRVLRQLVTESGILALAGGSMGLLLYWWFISVAATRVHMDLSPDLVTVGFTMVFALSTGILFGLSPALHATKAGVGTALRDSGAGTTRRSKLQGTFVVAQIVFSQPLLLLLAVILTEVAGDQRAVSTAGDRVISAWIRPMDISGGYTNRFPAVDTLAIRLATQPGIERVVHEASGFTIRNVVVENTSDAYRVVIEGTEPGFFAIQNAPIVLGRDVAYTDTASTDYAIVIGSNVARKFFGDANPIGRRLTSVQVKEGVRDSIAMNVVGVYDATQPTTRDGATDRIFTATGHRWRHDVLLIRTVGPADAYVPTLRTFLRTNSTTTAVREMQTIAQEAAEDSKVSKQIMAMAIGAAVLALAIASIGLFAVVALSVGQRTKEIGIRIALGGRPWRVAGAFFAAGLRLCAIGIAIGLPVSIAALKVLMSIEVLLAPDFSTPVVGIGIATVMLVVASAATWFPARRAAVVDPTLALRAE
jgi:predicted permease